MNVTGRALWPAAEVTLKGDPSYPSAPTGAELTTAVPPGLETAGTQQHRTHFRRSHGSNPTRNLVNRFNVHSFIHGVC